jgi:hypothetical protein
VDNDPVVCVHGRAILANSPTVAMMENDLREPEKIIDGAVETGLIDWSEPVGVLMLGILHYFSDPSDEVARIREVMAPGSHLVISHLSVSKGRVEEIEKIRGVYAATTTSGLYPREVEDIHLFFGDFEILDSGRFIDSSVLRKFGPLGWGGIGRKK